MTDYPTPEAVAEALEVLRQSNSVCMGGEVADAFATLAAALSDLERLREAFYRFADNADDYPYGVDTPEDRLQYALEVCASKED
jgi:hypothetical protein